MPAEVEVVAVHGRSCAEVVVLEKAVQVVLHLLDLEVVVQAAVLEVVLHPHAWVVEVVLQEVVEVVVQEVVAQPALVQHMLVEVLVNKPVPSSSMAV